MEYDYFVKQRIVVLVLRITDFPKKVHEYRKGRHMKNMSQKKSGFLKSREIRSQKKKKQENVAKASNSNSKKKVIHKRLQVKHT
jgi:hypothetical protein